jgi:hypothetical protein
LNGSVLAASVFSRRTVALVARGTSIEVEVIGKPLGHLDELVISTDQVSLTAADVEEAESRAVPPLYFASGALICRLGDEWWRLHPREPARTIDLLAIAPSRKLDEPRTAYRIGNRALVSSPAKHLDGADRIIFGHDEMFAWYDEGAWMVEPGRARIRVPDGAEPFGLLSLNGVPTLACRSKGGLLIRLCTAAGHRTLTDWPHVRSMPSLHPLDPLLAVELPDRVQVIDLSDDRVIADLRSDA